jgi:cell division protein FtsW (lipid II flippase)
VLSSKAFFVAHKGAMRVTVAAVMFVVLFRWDRPTPMVVFWIVVVTLLLLAIVEFFGREVTDQAEIGQAA